VEFSGFLLGIDVQGLMQSCEEVCVRVLLLVCCWSVQFLKKIRILQGSVATCFMCGGIFSNCFIANLRLNVAVKKF